MKKIIYPDKAEWADMLRRPALHTETLRDTVKEVLDRVKSEGDRAVIEYEERFDKVKLDALAVTEAEMAEAEKDVPIELKALCLHRRIFMPSMLRSVLKERKYRLFRE